MAAKPILIDTSCPGCKKDHVVTVDPNEIALAMGKVHDDVKPTSEYEAMTGKIGELEKMVKELKIPVAALDEEKLKEKPKKSKIPPHVKKYKCKNCGELHKNEEFEGPPRGRCDNCGAIFTKKGGKCPFCKPGEIEELSEDDIEEMELYGAGDEDEEEHEEHDHE